MIKNYMEYSEDKETLMMECKCCGEKAIGRLVVGKVDSTSKSAFKDNGTTVGHDVTTLFLCDNCKRELVGMLTEQEWKKDFMGKETKIKTYYKK